MPLLKGLELILRFEWPLPLADSKHFLSMPADNVSKYLILKT